MQAATPEEFLEELRTALPTLPLSKVRSIRASLDKKLSRLRKKFPASDEVSYSGPMDPNDVLDQIRILESAVDLCDVQIAIRERIQNEGSVSRQAEKSRVTARPEKLLHSKDYASVRIRGSLFTLTGSQGAVIRELHEAWENGTPDLTESFLLERLETGSKRLRDTFKSNMPAWKALIASKRKGSFRLNLPEKDSSS